MQLPSPLLHGTARRALAASILLAVATLSGCATTTQRNAIDAPPVIAKVDDVNAELRELPPPKEKIVVAVYDLEDLTGQYKERDNVQSLSRAVTQGGGEILITALQDAGDRRWFTVLERKDLNNLLKERQIVTEMRRLYRNEQNVNASVLPPLLHAGIIIEGAIIGYDTNTVTGGAGAGFLAISASTKYVQDTVTVTLRAVSTKSGEVLATVTARKAIASYALSGGAFRYVKLDELLEAEAGVTYNEPKQIAVQSVIEKAVIGLIIEGAERGVWSFSDPVSSDKIARAYRDDKYGKQLTKASAPAERVETEPPLSVNATAPLPPRQPVRPAATSASQPAPAQDAGSTINQIIRGGPQNPNAITPQSQPPAAAEEQKAPPPAEEGEPALG